MRDRRTGVGERSRPERPPGPCPPAPPAAAHGTPPRPSSCISGYTGARRAFTMPRYIWRLHRGSAGGGRSGRKGWSPSQQCRENKHRCCKTRRSTSVSRVVRQLPIMRLNCLILPLPRHAVSWPHCAADHPGADRYQCFRLNPLSISPILHGCFFRSRPPCL